MQLVQQVILLLLLLNIALTIWSSQVLAVVVYLTVAVVVAAQVAIEQEQLHHLFQGHFTQLLWVAVAQVAQVSQDNLAIRVHRVVCAVDCGIAVNPQSIAAQMESCITFGLGMALHSKLTLKDGAVVQSNYHDYQVLRLNEMPVVEVHIVPSSDKPGGIGEAGVPPTAPAVANAVYALTGQRLRELPLQLSGV